MVDPADDERTILIKDALRRSARSLPELVRDCQGIYPTEARELLAGMVAAGSVTYVDRAYALSETGPTADHTPVLLSTIADGLPEPHPHDCDWRFTQPTVQLLAERLCSCLPSPIVLLGAPTVYVAIVRSTPAAPVFLVDWSHELIRILAESGFAQGTLLAHNMLSGQLAQPTTDAGAILIDPPWYGELVTW